MMDNLLLEEGYIVQIESISLHAANFLRFQPQSVDFLDISNPKAVLKNGLRNFACLTTEDMIAIKYNQKIYELRELETKPGNVVSIIECDMNVEFAAPADYEKPERPKQSDGEMDVDYANIMPEPVGFVAIRGGGKRLNGKQKVP